MRKRSEKKTSAAREGDQVRPVLPTKTRFAKMEMPDIPGHDIPQPQP
jgi:hypothetical protein